MENKKIDRRSFIKAGAILGTAATLPRYSMANMTGGKKFKLGLIGCGGRGTGATADCLSGNPDVEIVAIADLWQDKIDSFEDRLSKDLKTREKHGGSPDQIKVAHKFVGWDAYQKLCQTDVDIIIEATPPAFRPKHAEAIISAGKHAFLEKPAGVDATQMHQMLAVSKMADEKGLSIVCGTQRHYHLGYIEAMKRIQDGQIGKIVAAQCYWNSGGYVGDAQTAKAPDFIKALPYDSLEYQTRLWFSFIWASGDHIVEQHVHNLDVILWGLGNFEVMPQTLYGMGGRSTDLEYGKYGDRWSHFNIDYDFGNELHLASYCRQDPKCTSFVGERFIGTKGTLFTHLQGDQVITGDKPWKAEADPLPALIREHQFLLNAVRTGNRVNKLPNLIKSTTMGIAGRMSAYSGKQFKYDWVMARSKENILPADLTKFGTNPLNGVPVPGKYQLI